MLTGLGVGTPHRTPFPPTSGHLLYLPGVCSHSLQRKGTSPMCSRDTGIRPARNALTCLKFSLGCPMVPIFGPRKLGQEEALFPGVATLSVKGSRHPFLSTQPHLTGPDHLEVEMSSQAHCSQPLMVSLRPLPLVHSPNSRA